MSLSGSEIERLLEKLRSQYIEYAEKFSPRWFDIEAFEERYLMALENDMNLEAFVLAEITNLEKIKSKYEKKKEARRKSQDFTERIEKIMDDNLERVRKYPSIQFHPDAGIEIKHFYGALNDFTESCFSVLWVIVKDQRVKSMLDLFDSKLNELAVPRGKIPPRRIEDHINTITRPYSKEIDIERDRNDYLKESAFLLHDIIHFCDELIEMREDDWENPVRFDRLFVEDGKKRRIVDMFQNLTGYGAILRVKEYAEEIIEDFRLKAFRRE